MRYLGIGFMAMLVMGCLFDGGEDGFPHAGRYAFENEDTLIVGDKTWTLKTKGMPFIQVTGTIGGTETIDSADAQSKRTWYKTEFSVTKVESVDGSGKVLEPLTKADSLGFNAGKGEFVKLVAKVTKPSYTAFAYTFLGKGVYNL